MPARLLRFIRDTFGFSVAETRGFLLLLFLLGLLLAAPFLGKFLPDAVPDTSAADQKRLDEFVATLDIPTSQRSGTAERGTRPTDADEARTSRPVRYFAFDPNTISSEQWQELGLPRWLAERIGKYRAKGGRFRKKEDLLRIYDFPEDTYRSLEPYIRLPGEVPTRVPADGLASTPGTPTPTAGRPEVPRPARFTFELNSADTTALKRVYGIGSKLSARIVNYRESLGGFAHENQVREVWGLDSTVVDELLKHATLRTTELRKLNVNSGTAEQLRHPYLKFHIARALVAYRQQHGAFNSPDDLLQVKLLDVATLARLKPYLEF